MAARCGWAKNGANRVTRWGVRCAIIALLAPMAGWCGGTAMPLAAYQKQDWEVEDGLPQSQIRALTQAPNGAMLIATYGGLAFFDGLHFTPLRVDARDKVASEAV